MVSRRRWNARRGGRWSDSTSQCHRSTWRAFGPTTHHHHAATSGRCRTVIDNQRHLAPATGNIECLPPRKSIYVPLGVVQQGHCPRRDFLTSFLSMLLFPPYLSPSLSFYVCVSVSQCRLVDPCRDLWLPLQLPMSSSRCQQWVTTTARLKPAKSTK